MKSSMSLLNEVLRDIDQRRGQVRDEQILTSALVIDAQVKQDWVAPIIAFMMIFVCGSITYWVVSQSHFSDITSAKFELPLTSTALQNDMFIEPVITVTPTVAPQGIEFIMTKIVLPKPSSNAVTSTKILSTDVSRIEKPIHHDMQLNRQQVFEGPEIVVDLYHKGSITLNTVQSVMSRNSASWQSEELGVAVDRIAVSLLSVDDLKTVLEINRDLESLKSMNRSKSILNIFSQLRLKSSEPGYWAFQQAVMLDKIGEFRSAYYYYRQAIQTSHISVRQRSLSEARIQQLKYQLR